VQREVEREEVLREVVEGLVRLEAVEHREEAACPVAVEVA
jgi:hypothetical protein